VQESGLLLETIMGTEKFPEIDRFPEQETKPFEEIAPE
jgi:hypothetical protein